ncbi:helix-turn-helix domain-containing protein [Kitasatospora sp. NPDC056138]|uniref:helix-turn-helix domain-containing protein n=1 Tax=Kitasatospora sp. NPDC056138 TaxID=3345724 RepID=UPI0035E005F5
MAQPTVELTVATKGKRIAGAERELLAADLKQRYEAGATIRALVEDTGRSYGSVHRLLSDAGVIFRPRAAIRGKQRT